MPLYLGSEKIKSKDYGLWVGGSKIKLAYFGSTLVYQYIPYTPSQNLVNLTGEAGPYTITLYPGSYNVEVSGGGSTGSYWYNGRYSGGTSGGGGGTVKGTFVVLKTCTATYFACTYSGTSYLKINGNDCLIARSSNGTTGGTSSKTAVANYANVDGMTTYTGGNGSSGLWGQSSGRGYSDHGWATGADGSGFGNASTTGAHGGVWITYNG